MVVRADLPPLLEAIIRESALTKKAFADEVGLTSSAISRYLRGDPRHVMPIEACLRVAKRTGYSPAKLLRAAGHGDVVDLIEDLFGVAAERRAHFVEGRRLTAADERLLAQYRSISPKVQRHLQGLLEHFAQRDTVRRPHPPALPPKKVASH
jgi:transcriptional regulator with XRE-family HTH domain